MSRLTTRKTISWSACIATAIAALSVSPSTALADHPIEAALRLVPDNANVVVVIPHVKYLSDQITQCLAGMDRAGVLIGTRPIDQVKSLVGFNVGINEVGPMAVYLAGNELDFTKAGILIPVSSAPAFMEGNFAKHEGSAYSLANGRSFYARDLKSHVLLSQNAAVVADYLPGEAWSAAPNKLGSRGWAVLGAGEAMILANPKAMHAVFEQARQRVGENDNPIRLLENLNDQIDIAAIAIDFDPLAVIIRTLAKANPESELARLAIGKPSLALGLKHLPNKPFYVAYSADLDAMGGAANIAMAAGIEHVEDTWSLAAGMEFAAYPSSAGLAGGLLNDAVAVVKSPDSGAMHAAMKQQLMNLQELNGGASWQVKWEENKAIKEGLIADAYEAKLLNAPDGNIDQHMMFQYLFGPSGRRGFIKQAGDLVVMTFSQRPAVLEAALAVSSDTAEPKASLGAGSAAIKTMRQFMPAKLQLEAYLGVGQWAQIARQFAATVGMADQVPQVDPAAPPVGFGLSLSNGEIESATVVPAAVLAAALDQVQKLMTPRMRQSQTQPSDSPSSPHTP